ncbi:MAG: methionyl-tRNA formyltransferase [Planctomycetes bacterium]|nr:methionyl-tRNA formyltransferase [Planctomycetota bacterium]
MNLVFMGTSPFAVPALERLLASPHRVMAVVTQPDRPRGRGQEVQPSPVKDVAVARGVHLFQPENVNEYDFVRELRALSPDVIVVAAYGQKLLHDILTLPRWYCINIHPSLLPRYRGPAPVARAILRGETFTGVCVVKVVEKMDAGPILGLVRVPLDPDITTPELESRLAGIGGELLLEVLENIQNQTVVELPQNDREATWAPKFEKNDGRIDWRKPAGRIKDFVRALQPFPGAFTLLHRARLTIWKAEAVRGPRPAARPGAITAVEKDRFRVACADGEVALLEVQPESKKRMSAAEFISGYQPKPGEMLG